MILAIVVAMCAPTGTLVYAGGAQLSTASGTLTITSEPPGAQVFVDDQPAGTTPLTIAPISAGNHRVRVVKDGFLENARTVNVRNGRTEAQQIRLTSRGPSPAQPTGGAQPAGNQPSPQGLRIVIVEGEDLVNIVQQRTAVRTVVEVRDRNNNPVAGAALLFRLSGNGATLNGGTGTVSLVTNAAGQASVSVAPAAGAASGSAVNLSVTATFNGQTAVASVGSSAAATTASSGSGAGAGGGSGAGAGAGAGATTGAVAGGAAAGGGILGLSTLAFVGVAGGAATAGVVAAKVAGGNKPPTAGVITPSTTSGFVGVNSTISFSAKGSDPDNDSLTYAWDFGDGGSGTGESVTHTYASAGTFTVKVTVNDGKESATTQTTVTIKSLAGTWRSDAIFSQAGNLPMSFAFTTSGTTIGGSFTQGVGTGPVAGTLSASVPQVTFTVTPSIGAQVFTPFVLTGSLSANFDSISGALNGSGYTNSPITIVRQ